jgi:hypothetical protein
MNFTANDIFIMNEPLEFIKQRPKMFLRNISGVELAMAVVAGACLMTEKPVTVRHKEPWWLVGSEMDWLGSQPGVSIQDFFSRIIPFPEAGPNSMRGEILLAAFAADIVVHGKPDTCVVKGKVLPTDEIWHFIRTNPEWLRVVAFRMGA